MRRSRTTPHSSRRRRAVPPVAGYGASAGARDRTPLVRYDGRVVAVSSETRVWLMPSILALPEDHPRRRFVGALCLVWRELRADGWDRPEEEAAEVLARAILMRDEEFLDSRHESDERLAERFGVPLEEVSRKRADLGIAPR
jgi:hypothetical protein